MRKTWVKMSSLLAITLYATCGHIRTHLLINCIISYYVHTDIKCTECQYLL